MLTELGGLEWTCACVLRRTLLRYCALHGERIRTRGSAHHVLTTEGHTCRLREERALSEGVRARHLWLEEACLLWCQERLEGWLLQLLLLLRRLETERVGTHRHSGLLWEDEPGGLRLQLGLLPEGLGS